MKRLLVTEGWCGLASVTLPVEVIAATHYGACKRHYMSAEWESARTHAVEKQRDHVCRASSASATSSAEPSVRGSEYVRAASQRQPNVMGTHPRLIGDAVSPAGASARVASEASQLSRGAIEALIAANYPGLRALIRRRMADSQAAADLLGEATRISWEKWQSGKIERADQIAGYIFRVAINLLRNRSREMGERRDRRAAPSVLTALPSADDPEARSVEDALARSVKQLLLAMPSPRDREVLKRFYLDEEDKQSICGSLGLNPLQFDKVLHRARGRLKKQLEKHGMHQSDVLSLLVVV